MTPAELLADPWAFGPWCLVVGEVRAFAPIHGVRGMLGRWPLPLDVRTTIRALTGLDVVSGFTLQQPFASAIAAGPKRIENRPQPWKVPDCGLWVALHAGRTFYGGGRAARLMLERWRTPRYRCDDCGATGGNDDQAFEFCDDSTIREVNAGPYWPDAPEIRDVPTGAVIGAMRVDACLPYPAEGALL